MEAYGFPFVFFVMLAIELRCNGCAFLFLFSLFFFFLLFPPEGTQGGKKIIFFFLYTPNASEGTEGDPYPSFPLPLLLVIQNVA